MFTVPDSLTQFLRSEHALLIAVSFGWLVICFTWWRASRRRAALRRAERVTLASIAGGQITQDKVAAPPADVVFVDEPRGRYKSFEEFRGDLVEDKVPVLEVLDRCDGVIPPPRAVPPRPAAPVPPPVPRLDVGNYSVSALTPGVWAVWDRSRGFGAAQEVSRHLTYEEALKQAKYLNYER